MIGARRDSCSCESKPIELDSVREDNTVLAKQQPQQWMMLVCVDRPAAEAGEHHDNNRVDTPALCIGKEALFVTDEALFDGSRLERVVHVSLDVKGKLQSKPRVSSR